MGSGSTYEVELGVRRGLYFIRDTGSMKFAFACRTIL